MKKIFNKSILLVLIVLYAVSLYAQPPLHPEDQNLPFTNKNLTFETRALSEFSTPCTCDCNNMIKATKYLPTGNEKDINAFGGYRVKDNVNNVVANDCQKFELNVSACNGVPISNLSFKLQPTNAPCNSKELTLFAENASGNVTQSGDPFKPEDEGYGTFNFYETIPACSSKKFTFYICGVVSDCYFKNLTIQVNLSAYGPCFETRELTFKFDGIVPVELDKKDEQGSVINSKSDNIKLTFEKDVIKYSDDLKIRIVDLQSNLIYEGQAISSDNIHNIINKLDKNNKLLIINYIKNNKIINTEKITINK
jgi:hypothetical protein